VQDAALGASRIAAAVTGSGLAASEFNGGKSRTKTARIGDSNFVK
jgi:hypothetical protein